MGCDGGTIPRRDELVKTKKKPEQKDKVSELTFKWKHCAISQEKLVRPIVACELGLLYNKESVLEVFIKKIALPSQFQHLRGLRDIKELNLTENPAKQQQGPDKGDAYIDSNAAEFICPVVGLEMSGKCKFCILWSCGCVLSDRALKEVKSQVCLKCGKEFTDLDIITLNGTKEEVSALESRMVSRRALAKEAKKAKKDKKRDEPGPSTSKSGFDSASSSSTASEEKVKKSVSNDKEAKSSSSGKLIIPSSTNGKAVDKAGVKRKGGIQNDPTASKTFKSLFTSSDAAQRQQQPHWVTYNPMYY